MRVRSTGFRSLLAAACLCAGLQGAVAQTAEPARTLWDSARAIAATAEAKPTDMRAVEYGIVRAILDLIVNDHPETDIARRIVGKERIEGLDVAQLDRYLAAATGAEPDPAGVASLPGFGLPADPDPPDLASGPAARAFPADAAGRMRLSQELLNAVGCDVGTPDGVPGRKTRRGYEDYLQRQGLRAEDYALGSVDLLARLSAARGEVCPPRPVIRLTPANMSGRWSYVSTCGPRSRLPNQRVTGSLDIAHAGGGAYRGPIANSQGLTGEIDGVLSGRSFRATVRWGFLFGRIEVSGAIETDELSMSGRDSNGCGFFAVKN